MLRTKGLAIRSTKEASKMTSDKTRKRNIRTIHADCVSIKITKEDVVFGMTSTTFVKHE